MFLSITVGVIDKIKKTAFHELDFSPQYKDLQEKYIYLILEKDIDFGKDYNENELVKNKQQNDQ